MRRLFPLITVCLLVSAAEPLFAQQRLFARMDQEVVELDPRPASLGTVIRRFSLPAEARGRTNNVVPFGGGEFLAWVSDGVVLLNTRSGAVQRFAFPDFFPTRVIGTDGNTRLLVLGTNVSQHDVVLVADARSASVRFLDVGPTNWLNLGPFNPPVSYAPASDVLFVAKPRGPGADTYHDVDVIQASTGALLRTLDIWPLSAGALLTNAAGTRLYVNGSFAFDVVTGTQFASPSGPFGALDEQRNRLIGHSVNPPGPRGIAAFSADSLEFLGRVQVPELPLPAPPRNYVSFLVEHIDVSDLSATIFVLQGVGVRYKYYDSGACHESQLIALDAGTGQVRRTVRTTAALGPDACHSDRIADLVRVTEPAPPSAPTASVSGHQVTLKWQAPFGATQYEVEAGSAPGLANLATIGVTEPQLVIDGVPSGVYHLRVRGINTIGRGAPSQELRLVVP